MLKSLLRRLSMTHMGSNKIQTPTPSIAKVSENNKDVDNIEKKDEHKEVEIKNSSNLTPTTISYCSPNTNTLSSNKPQIQTNDYPSKHSESQLTNKSQSYEEKKPITMVLDKSMFPSPHTRQMSRSVTGPMGEKDRKMALKGRHRKERDSISNTVGLVDQLDLGLCRPRYNSTSSLYIQGTLSNPHSQDFLYALSRFIYEYINQSYNHTSIFDEPHPNRFKSKHHQDSPSPNSHCPYPPYSDLTSVTNFTQMIFKEAQLVDECMESCLIYLERVIDMGMILSRYNWRPLVLTILLLASKVWDDLSMVNMDFSSIFQEFSNPAIGNHLINHWEVALINLINFNVTVTATLYAITYFRLHDLLFCNPQSGLITSSRPLDIIRAYQLELSSHTYTVKSREYERKRAYTIDSLQLPQCHNNDDLYSSTPIDRLSQSHGRLVIN